MSRQLSPGWVTSTLGWEGIAAVSLAFIAFTATGYGVWRVGSAWLAPKPGALKASEEAKKSAEQQAATFAGYLAQIDGRSLLVQPAAPVEPVEEVATEPTTPTDPPKPSTYGGPSMTAMMLDSAWFVDGTRLVAGGESKGDLRVVSLNPPYEAVVEWKGVEFKVPLFDRDKVVLKEASKASTPEPAEAATKEDPAGGATESPTGTPKDGEATEPAAPEPADAEPAPTPAEGEAPKPVEPAPSTQPTAPPPTSPGTPPTPAPTLDPK